MIYGFNAGEVFKIALHIEDNGSRFYEKAQAKTSNPEIKKIFQDLGLEELKHKQRFTELMSELPSSAAASTVWDPDNEIDQYLKMMADMHVFRDDENVEKLLDQTSGEAEALKLGIQFEKDSIVFFAEMQNLSESAQGRDKIGWLVQEEQKHLKRLALMLKKLSR